MVNIDLVNMVGIYTINISLMSAKSKENQTVGCGTLLNVNCMYFV